jgi:small subunit ribosomal protein S20
MANIKSAKKRTKTNEKRRQRNVARRSDVKTSIKQFMAALKEKNIDSAKKELKTVESKIKRAASKRVYKKNTASRKVSRLAKALAKLTQ